MTKTEQGNVLRNWMLLPFLLTFLMKMVKQSQMRGVTGLPRKPMQYLVITLTSHTEAVPGDSDEVVVYHLSCLQRSVESTNKIAIITKNFS